MQQEQLYSLIRISLFIVIESNVDEVLSMRNALILYDALVLLSATIGKIFKIFFFLSRSFKDRAVTLIVNLKICTGFRSVRVFDAKVLEIFCIFEFALVVSLLGYGFERKVNSYFQFKFFGIKLFLLQKIIREAIKCSCHTSEINRR